MKRNKLQRIFCPTEEELQEDYAKINAIIDEDIRKNGENCRNCAHSVCVQQSPYYDYITCTFDRTLEFGYGKTDHRCDRYCKAVLK